jgi:DNA-binding beta-propeller fold protein YncE
MNTKLIKKQLHNVLNKSLIILTWNVISVIFVLSSCKDSVIEKPITEIKPGQGLFVINEGTFSYGNASLHYLNLENDSLNTYEDLFKPANNRPLGDIFQSLSIIDNLAWLIVNNSGKIEVINPSTFKSVATIKGLRSPRFAKEVIPGKAYVTDLYANAVSIIDVKSFAKTGEIDCPGWTEELIIKNNEVWVSNHNRNFVYVINALSDLVADSVEVAYGGSSILEGKDGNIYLLCSGDNLVSKTGGVFCIEPKTKKVIKQWLFDKIDFNPTKLKENPNGDSLYFINQGVYGFPNHLNSKPIKPLIAQNSGTSFYGLFIDSKTGRLVVSNAKDFVSRGEALIYSRNGVLLKTYKAGVVPGEFYAW